MAQDRCKEFYGNQLMQIFLQITVAMEPKYSSESEIIAILAMMLIMTILFFLCSIVTLWADNMMLL